MDGGCTESEVTSTGSPEGQGAQQGSSNRTINGNQRRWDSNEAS